MFLQMTKSTLVVLIGDTHIGSMSSPWPSVPTPIGNLQRVVQGNEVQEAMFHCLMEFIANAQLAAESDTVDKVITVMMGDMIEMDAKKRTDALMSTSLVHLATFSADMLQSLAELSDKVFVLRGTEAHTGTDGQADQALAMVLHERLGDRVVKDAAGGDYAWRHLKLNIDGVRCDFAHHPIGGGMRPWTRRNGINALVASEAMYALENGEVQPDVIIRGHRHFADTTSLYARPFGIQTPTFQWGNEYSDRLGLYNGHPSIGGGLLYCQDGKFTYEPVPFAPAGEQPDKYTEV